MQIDRKRKFLLTDLSVIDGHRGFPIVHGRLAERAPVIAVRTFGSFAFLTIKGQDGGTESIEFEYPVPLEDAQVMLDRLCVAWPIQKTRYLIPHGALVVEVDVFEGRLSGLVIAEMDVQPEAADLPPWLGAEVTDDPRFDEDALARAETPPFGGQATWKP